MPASDLFEIPSVFAELEKSIASIRKKMAQEVARDPLPKFSLVDIREITQWLQRANNAMEEFIISFHGENLHHTGDELLKSKLKAARESSLKLGELLNDQSGRYTSFNLQHLTITESSQGHETRRELNSLIQFFKTFGKATWLGNLLTAEYQEKQSIALDLLRELLTPSQRKQIPPLAYHPSVQGITHRSFSTLSEGLKDQKDSLQNATSRNAEENFRALKDTFTYMLSIVTQEEQRYLDLQAEMNGKMRALREFAETAQNLPTLLKKYLLIRVGDISVQDLPAVKAWVGKDEITIAQRLLEEFRDAAVQEKSVREMCARMNGSRTLSYASSFSVISSPDGDVLSTASTGSH